MAAPSSASTVPAAAASSTAAASVLHPCCRNDHCQFTPEGQTLIVLPCTHEICTECFTQNENVTIKCPVCGLEHSRAEVQQQHRARPEKQSPASSRRSYALDAFSTGGGSQSSQAQASKPVSMGASGSAQGGHEIAAPVAHVSHAQDQQMSIAQGAETLVQMAGAQAAAAGVAAAFAPPSVLKAAHAASISGSGVGAVVAGVAAFGWLAWRLHQATSQLTAQSAQLSSLSHASAHQSDVVQQQQKAVQSMDARITQQLLGAPPAYTALSAPLKLTAAPLTFVAGTLVQAVLVPDTIPLDARVIQLEFGYRCGGEPGDCGWHRFRVWSVSNGTFSHVWQKHVFRHLNQAAVIFNTEKCWLPLSGQGGDRFVFVECDKPLSVSNQHGVDLWIHAYAGGDERAAKQAHAGAVKQLQEKATTTILTGIQSKL